MASALRPRGCTHRDPADRLPPARAGRPLPHHPVGQDTQVRDQLATSRSSSARAILATPARAPVSPSGCSHVAWSAAGYEGAGLGRDRSSAHATTAHVPRTAGTRRGRKRAGAPSQQGRALRPCPIHRALSRHRCGRRVTWASSPGRLSMPGCPPAGPASVSAASLIIGVSLLGVKVSCALLRPWQVRGTRGVWEHGSEVIEHDGREREGNGGGRPPGGRRPGTRPTARRASCTSDTRGERCCARPPRARSRRSPR